MCVGGGGASRWRRSTPPGHIPKFVCLISNAKAMRSEGVDSRSVEISNAKAMWSEDIDSRNVD